MESEEHDPERLPEDPEPFPAKGPVGELELSDEELDRQGAAKQAATEALEEGDTLKALESFTEAITIGNVSAMLYAKRADVLLKLQRPCACISDCSSAIEINPDSAKAYRIRGKAYRKLGRWDEAHKDLSLSQKLDYDEDLDDMQKFVTEKLRQAAEAAKPARPAFSLHESWQSAESSAHDIGVGPESHEVEYEEEEDEEDEGVEEMELEPPPSPPPQPVRTEYRPRPAAPAATASSACAARTKEEEMEEDEEDEQQGQEKEKTELGEEDPELLPMDPGPFPAKGPEGETELSDEQRDRQEAARQAGMDALEQGGIRVVDALNKALVSFTQAICFGNASAGMYAKRAEILLKLKRPCACISDCSSAIEVNPNSAKAYRIRGKAFRKLGKWEEAHIDFSKSQQLDYDDDEDFLEMQKFVAEKRNRILEKTRENRAKELEVEAERFQENLLRRRKANDERMQAEAEAKAKADAQAKAEAAKSLWGRCKACARRMSGGKKDDPPDSAPTDAPDDDAPDVGTDAPPDDDLD